MRTSSILMSSALAGLLLGLVHGVTTPIVMVHHNQDDWRSRIPRHPDPAWLSRSADAAAVGFDYSNDLYPSIKVEARGNGSVAVRPDPGATSIPGAQGAEPGLAIGDAVTDFPPSNIPRREGGGTVRPLASKKHARLVPIPEMNPDGAESMQPPPEMLPLRDESDGPEDGGAPPWSD